MDFHKFGPADVLLLPLENSSNRSGQDSGQTDLFYSNEHSGNIELINLLDHYRDSYLSDLAARNFASCDNTAACIVNTICQSYGGRFLEYIADSNSWEDLGDEIRATERVKLALNDMSKSFHIPIMKTASLERENIFSATSPDLFDAKIFSSHSDTSSVRGENNSIGESYSNVNSRSSSRRSQRECVENNHFQHDFDQSLNADAFHRGGGSNEGFQMEQEIRNNAPHHHFSHATSTTPDSNIDNIMASVEDDFAQPFETNTNTDNHESLLNSANLAANMNYEVQQQQQQQQGTHPQAFSTPQLPKEWSTFQPRESCFDTASSLFSNASSGGSGSNVSTSSSMYQSLKSVSSNTSRPLPKKPSKGRSGKTTRKKKTMFRRGGSISSSKINLRDARYQCDPKLAKLAHSAARSIASETTTDDLSEFRGLSTFSNPDSEQSEVRGNSRRPTVKGLRAKFLSQRQLERWANVSNYSSSEIDYVTEEKCNKVTLLDQTTVREISEFDVICQVMNKDKTLVGSGVGNNRLKCLLQSRREKYLSTTTTEMEKDEIVQKIVQEVANGKGNGIFIAESDDGSYNYELDNTSACIMLKSILTHSGYDASVLDLPAPSKQRDTSPDSGVDESGSIPNEMNSFSTKELQNIKRKKGKKVISSNLGHTEIEKLQYEMRSVGTARRSR